MAPVQLPMSSAEDLAIPLHELPAPKARQSLSERVLPRQLVEAIRFPAPFSLALSTSEDDSDSSSDDEEYREKVRADEAPLLEQGTSRAKRRWNRTRTFIASLVPLSVASVLIATFFLSKFYSVKGQHTFDGRGLKPVTLEALANGTFSVERRTIRWLREAGDGVYGTKTGELDVELHNVAKNETRVLVRGQDVKDVNGEALQWEDYQPSADMAYLMFAAEVYGQWRHSTTSTFYIHTLADSTTRQLSSSQLSITEWSPVNHHVAYVLANDLYILENPSSETVIRVTTSGSPTTFNAVPDWVYEEEVFSSDRALWWAPTADKLAFLSFDEQDVPEYSFPVYSSNYDAPEDEPYPTSTVMRYPKPGFPNPKVQLSVFDLALYLTLPSRPVLGGSATDPNVAAATYNLVFDTPFPEDNVIISEVAWVGRNELVVKATDRTGAHLRVAHFDLSSVRPGTVTGTVVRDVDYEALDGGWHESAQTVVGVEASLLLHANKSTTTTCPQGYFDIVPDATGFRHVAFFSPANASEPVFLTSGAWEVEGGIQAIDWDVSLLFVVAANPSTERHVYSISLPSGDTLAQLKTSTTAPNALTPSSEPGYYAVNFSPYAGFYVLAYQGPLVPWQRMVKVGDSKYDNVLVSNERLKKALPSFLMPAMNYTTFTSPSGIEMNVLEMRPPNLDPTGKTKYPVLFSVYGGPNSQKVSRAWFKDWHYVLVTTNNYVVVMIDGRGTGYKGRAFRSLVRNKLGKVEAEDVVDAATHYATLPFVDEARVGIWGWSYGGYLTCKVVEKNSTVISLGMAVAPVTDWRYYDTIYTERYMSTPALNGAGYDQSAVNDMEGFRHTDFLLAHGSGDDNVHFLNSASLLDKLTFNHVRGFRFRMFTDSDHSIMTRRAYWELMDWMGSFLVEKWGQGGQRRGKKEHLEGGD